MIFKFRSILAVLLVVNSSAVATTIQMGRGLGAGVNVLSSSGSVLPGGYSIYIGTFVTIPARDANLPAVLSAFTEFARTTSPTSGASTGLITAADSLSVTTTVSAQTAFVLNNALIYFIVISPYGEYGVLTGRSPTTGSWIFPTDTTVGAASANAAVSGAEVIFPITGAVVDNATGVDSFQLAIPEPCTFFVFAMGSLGFVFRRRR